MKKILLILALAASCAEPVYAKTPCCTSGEVQTLGDLNYIARAALNHTGDASTRLYTLAMQLKAGTWTQWNDPDRGYILGLMAATPDGQYAPNRALLEEFASLIGVQIKRVAIPTPSPVVVAPTPPVVVAPPPATSSGVIEDEIRRIVRDELAKLPAAGAGATTTSASYPDLVSQGNGELIFVGKDSGGNRQGGIRGDFRTIFGVNNYDGGSRALVNYGCFNPLLPESTYGVDSHGAFSYNGNPCPRGTWTADQTYGQAFVIDGGWSQAGYDYATGAQYKPSILLASQRGGMDILFAVTPWRTVGQPVLNKTVMRLRSDGSPNPVDVVIDGQLRTLKSCNVGGQSVLCF